MGSRALFSFHDRSNQINPVNVFMQYEGEPEYAIRFLSRSRLRAWDFPRYEANEFAAAFIAVNKLGAGGYRIMPCGDPAVIIPRFCSDIDFRYEIGPCITASPWVSGYAVNALAQYHERHLFSGSLDSLCRYPERLAEPESFEIA